eukprot:g1190.t1
MVVQTVSCQTPVNISRVIEEEAPVVVNSQAYGISYGGDPPSKALTLFKAVQHNQHVLVAQNLEEGADCEAFYSMEAIDSRCALRVAARDGNIRLCRLLLKENASCFAHLEKDRWTALHSAAYHGHEAVLKLIYGNDNSNLRHDVDARVDGFTSLHILAEVVNSNLPSGGADLMKWVLQQLTAVNDQAPGLGMKVGPAGRGQQGDIVNAKSDRMGFSEWTPLHICACRGKMKSIVHLLRYGADLHCRTGEFGLHTPGLRNLSQGDVVAYAAFPSASTPAAINQPLPISRSKTAFPDEHTFDSGLLPIHLAALGGHLRTLQFLLQQGQNINATTKRYRWTPLFFAVWGNHHAIVKEICRNGGRRFVNCTDRRADSQWTPLGLATLRGDVEMVQLLIAYG